jgi:hypothetical protein
MIMAYEQHYPAYGKKPIPLDRSQTMEQKTRFLITCFFALVLVMTTGRALAAQSLTFSGPLMRINEVEGYVVVNEAPIYFRSLPDPAIIDDLREGQWVSVEVVEEGGQLLATELTIGQKGN